MKSRIDEYNGVYVAFVGEGAEEKRRDFKSEAAAKAWVKEVAPAPKKKAAKPSKVAKAVKAVKKAAKVAE